jgi:hypothetical protein
MFIFIDAPFEHLIHLYKCSCIGITQRGLLYVVNRGGSKGGRTRRAPPLKLEKIMIFHTKYPKNFHASLRNWKKYDFLA